MPQLFNDSIAVSSFAQLEPIIFTLTEATVNDINRAIDSGGLTSERLVQLYLNRIDTYEEQGPGINALININPNALEQAREADRLRESGTLLPPLHGLPILLKDNFDTFERLLPTTGGSDVLAGSIPPDDAFTVREFRDAGAIILAKTNMSEFALSSGRLGYSSSGGLTLNPYNLMRDASGSSSGSGAAIAANFGVLATGTDTAGSIRGPSSFTGLVGIKPTLGLTSRDGIIPLALSVDVGGPMARTVADAAIGLGVMAGGDPSDPATLQSQGQIVEDYTQFLDIGALQGARIGVARDYFGGNAEVDAIVENAIAAMEAAGATTVECRSQRRRYGFESGRSSVGNAGECGARRAVNGGFCASVSEGAIVSQSHWRDRPARFNLIRCPSHSSRDLLCDRTARNGRIHCGKRLH